MGYFLLLKIATFFVLIVRIDRKQRYNKQPSTNEETVSFENFDAYKTIATKKFPPVVKTNKSSVWPYFVTHSNEWCTMLMFDTKYTVWAACVCVPN